MVRHAQTQHLRLRKRYQRRGAQASLSERRALWALPTCGPKRGNGWVGRRRPAPPPRCCFHRDCAYPGRSEFWALPQFGSRRERTTAAVPTARALMLSGLRVSRSDRCERGEVAGWRMGGIPRPARKALRHDADRTAAPLHNGMMSIVGGTTASARRGFKREQHAPPASASFCSVNLDRSQRSSPVCGAGAVGIRLSDKDVG